MPLLMLDLLRAGLHLFIDVPRSLLVKLLLHAPLHRFLLALGAMCVLVRLHGLVVQHPFPRFLLGMVLLHLGPALEFPASTARFALQLPLPAHVFNRRPLLVLELRRGATLL